MLKKLIGLLILLTVIIYFSNLSAMCGMPGCPRKEGGKHEHGPSEAKSEKDIKKYSEETKYTCPMHPEVVADKPGKCPKCGMNLEPKKTESKVKFSEETKYVCCPGCPNVVSNKPGKCPKCGMQLKKESKLYSYICPQKKCEYKSKEQGKCPHHKKDLKKTEVKLYCPMDDTELKTKDGKLYCPKCKMEIKPGDVKIKKIEKKKKIKKIEKKK